MNENVNHNLIFLHIEKAGGSTLHNILANYYSANKVLHLEYMSTGKEELMKINQETLTLVKGHIAFGVHKYLNHPFKYYSMMRNPLERVVSYYYYVKQKKSHHHSKLISDKNWNLSEYILKAENLQMDNGQVRYLSGSNKEFGKIDSTDLELAKQNIEKHFLTVGLTEYFDESILILRQLIGWKRLPVYERANVNTNKKEVHQITNEDREIITRMNKFDMELYDFVMKRFINESKTESVQTDLKKLHRATKIYYLKKGIKGLVKGKKKS